MMKSSLREKGVLRAIFPANLRLFFFRAALNMTSTAVIESVLSSVDLLEHILVDNVGVATYVAVRQVNSATRAVCFGSKTLLRAVALYQGGLSKREFAGLFSLNYQEAGRYPHKHQGRRHLFTASAIDQALAKPWCMWRIRVDAACSRHERDAYLQKRYGAPSNVQSRASSRTMLGAKRVQMRAVHPYARVRVYG